MGLASRHGLVVQEVATLKRSRDLACSVWCRDLDTVPVTVWILFMVTIHEHYSHVKKYEYNIFKNFLLYDLIYKIFILHLL